MGEIKAILIAKEPKVGGISHNRGVASWRGHNEPEVEEL